MVRFGGQKLAAKAAALSGVVAMSGGVVADLQAQDTVYNYSDNAITKSANDRSAILFDSVYSSFNATSQTLTWEATFNFNPLAPSHFTGLSEGALPSGFVLVLNDGGEPKGHVGELAAVYFDAVTDPDNPIVTVYAYNGGNSATSNRYGIDPMFADPAPGPVQIVSSLIDSRFLLDAELDDSTAGKRTLSMTLDVSRINSFDPTLGGINPEFEAYNYNTMSSDAGPIAEGWSGIGYDDTIGIWFPPFIAYADYAPDGFLKTGSDGWGMGADSVGYYDIEMRDVPEPASALLLAVGSVLLASGRRRGA